MRRVFVPGLIVVFLTLPLLAQTPVSDVSRGSRMTGNISGSWTLRLSPIIDPTMEATPIEIPATLFEINGTVLGRAGMLTLQGVRQGNLIDLEVHQTGYEQRDQAATIRLTVESSTSMRGTAVHLTMQEDAPFVVDEVLLYRSVAGASDVASSGLDPRAIETQISVGDLCGMVAGTITSAFTGGWFVPMNACSPKLNGGGYYLMGDVGPGARFFGTTTIYVPVEMAACSKRTYGFTLRSNGATTWAKILSWLQTDAAGQQIWSRLTAGHPGITQLEQLHAAAGDFAVLLGYSTQSHNATVYILSPHNSCDTIRNNQLVKSITHTVTSIMPHVRDVEVRCGKSEVSDTWSLRRSPYPSSSACNTPVVFVYLFGNIDVKLD